MKAFSYILDISDQSINLNLFHSKAWQIFLSWFHNLSLLFYLSAGIHAPPPLQLWISSKFLIQFTLIMCCWGCATSIESMNQNWIFLTSLIRSTVLPISHLIALWLFVASEFIVPNAYKHNQKVSISCN